MSLETVSTKRVRTYQRQFDHDEARSLRAEDPKRWTYRELAAHFDVTEPAIYRVVKPGAAERQSRRTVEFLRSRRLPCVGGCGTLVWPGADRSGLCIRCVGVRRSTTARPDALLCTRCREWKPDDEFSANKKAVARRGRITYCRPCAAAVRREFRHKHPESEKAAERRRAATRRQKGPKMAEFFVFTPNGTGDTYKLVARTEAGSPQGAVEKAAAEAGDYIAIPVTRWKTMRVAPVQALHVVEVADA